MKTSIGSACLAIVFSVVAANSADAQAPAATLDVVAAVDGALHSTQARSTAVWLDLFGAVRIADGLDFIARPVISRRTFDGDWQKQMYQLGFRYERRGAAQRDVGVRVEVGQMPSPIGIAMLENRADLNPVVSQHSAYYMPLPRVDPEIPRTFLIAGAYPFGAQMTVSSAKWDARVAALDSSPVRGRPFFGSNKPPRLLNGIVGGGLSPRVGLRFGAALAHGAYASVHEVSDRTRGDRNATMVQFEGEWSFGYTRIVAEWVGTAMETSRADAHAQGGWVQLTQTLSPRTFIATRFDSQRFEYEPPNATGLEHQRYQRLEGILGIRLTPYLTLRAGYLGRKGYVVSHWDDQVLGAVVWQRKVY